MVTSSRASGATDRSSRRRARIRRLIAGILILAALGAIGRDSAPWARREVQRLLAERAIAQGRLNDAEARLDLLVQEEPTRIRPRLLLVQVLRRQGRITEAEEVLQRTIEVGLPVEEGRREFALLSAHSDFPRAERSLRRLLEKEPGDLEVRRALEDRDTRERSRAGAGWQGVESDGAAKTRNAPKPPESPD